MNLASQSLIPSDTAKNLRESIGAWERPVAFGPIADVVGDVNYGGIGYFYDPSSQTALNCSATNKAGILDVRALENLSSLHCAHNQLTQLDVQGLTNLQSVFCHSNNFSSFVNDAILVALSGHGTPNGFAQLSLPTGASGAAARDYLVNSLQWLVVIT